MQERQTLILMTGCYRFDNLFHIAKTININYDKYFQRFHIYWLICKDIYNGFGNLNPTIDYLNTTHINYTIKDTGLPNQKNYGGSLFNKPLQEFVEENNLNNPWVYILDDDNIFHPNLYYTFNLCINNDNFKNKSGIILTKRSATTHVHEMYEANICQYLQSNNFRYIWFTPDPSQVILRYNLLKENGFYADKSEYDYLSIVPIIENNKQNMIYYNDYYGFMTDKINAYHNCLRTLNELDRFKEYDELCVDVNLQSNQENTPLNFPILSEEAKQKILNIIKEDLELYETRS